MLEVFTSVGAERFTLTWRNMKGEVVRLRKFWTLRYIHQMLPELLSEAGRDHHNLFIRPYYRGTSLIQLDDLTDERAAELIPMCFLTLKTSAAKSQAWIAIPASGDAEGDKDVRRRVKKAVRSDPMASGSVRVAGSRNFKPDYAPGRTGEKEFPVVSITHAAPGRITTREALEGQGLLVPAPPGSSMLPRASGRRSARWPDYQRCLDNAPLRMDGTARDRSLADFTWCKLAMELFRRSEEETAAELIRVSAKAQEKGEVYAKATAGAAARALARSERAQARA